MKPQKKYHFALLIILQIFISSIFSQVTLNPEKTVNPATGEMGFSLPLANVQDGTGRSFPITLGYKGGIKTSQPASTVGLGFGISTGEITRKVVMVPDDETNAYIDEGESIYDYNEKLGG